MLNCFQEGTHLSHHKLAVGIADGNFCARVLLQFSRAARKKTVQQKNINENGNDQKNNDAFFHFHKFETASYKQDLKSGSEFYHKKKRSGFASL